MEYTEAGKFLKTKRKSVGFSTQKSFIQALLKADPEINCSESYMSLIESGAKSPSVHLLDVISEILKLTPQEKGELLLIYKRVPNDLEFAVRSNLKESLKATNIDILKSKYKEEPNKQNFSNLIRALFLEDKKDEAIELLKSVPSFSDNFTDLQERTAKIAAMTGNYDFAIQAFNLALESCDNESIFTRADILMNIGICYFSKAMKTQDSKPVEALDHLFHSKMYLEKSIAVMPDYIYCLDEYARCSYHIADVLQYFNKNETDIKYSPKDLTYLAEVFQGKSKVGFDSKIIQSKIQEFFKTAMLTYRSIISHSERADLPEKALKEAVYFHAYSHCKLKMFDEALLFINSINILDRNWLTNFLKAGYYVLRYESEKVEKYLDDSLKSLETALEYEPEILKDLIRTEKNKELKTLWQLRQDELNKLLEKEVDA